MALPRTVAEHGKGRLLGLFLDGEEAAEQGTIDRQSQHLGADRRSADDGRFVAGAEHPIGRRERREPRQRAAALAESHHIDGVQWISEFRVRHARWHEVQIDGALAAPEGDRAEQCGVHRREQRGIHADDERERRNAGQGIRRAAGQCANGLTELEHSVSLGCRPWRNLSHIPHHDDEERSCAHGACGGVRAALAPRLTIETPLALRLLNPRTRSSSLPTSGRPISRPSWDRGCTCCPSSCRSAPRPRPWFPSAGASASPARR